MNTIVTAMVAVSFGSYASEMFANDSVVWAKVFAGLIVLVMMMVNVAGSTLVARAQSVIVVIVIGILALFAIVTIANMDTALLAPSGYPPFRDIFSSVALTFFAFLGFGIVTFTAKDLREPSRELPRAMYLALGIAAVIYVAVSLGVFGTLTVDAVIASGGTALAVAAEPSLGQAGYWLMSVTGLFATAGATNGGLYPAAGLCEQLAKSGQFPPLMGRRLGNRLPVGLLITAAGAVLLAVGFSLTAIASIGSAAALLIFTLVTVGHLRVRSQTGAKTAVLVLGVVTTGLSFLTFVFTTLVTEPVSAIALILILLLSAGLDVGWKRRRNRLASTRRVGEESTRRSRPARPSSSQRHHLSNRSKRLRRRDEHVDHLKADICCGWPTSARRRSATFSIWRPSSRTPSARGGRLSGWSGRRSR